jgi:hypothetical protein
LSLCLAAAGLAVAIAADTFTLSWTHTVEKTAWFEAWRVEAGGLRLAEARVKGSGAGMEPPPRARLVEGFYRWEPGAPAVPQLLLGRAPEAGDWTLCAAGRCAELGDWLRPQAGLVRLSAAEQDSCHAL